jgi:hypothetical protein
MWMREKILSVLRPEFCDPRDAEALAGRICDAIGEGQEPADYQFQDRNGKWNSFIDDRHMKDTIADGSWPIRAIYTTPQPFARGYDAGRDTGSLFTAPQPAPDVAAMHGMRNPQLYCNKCGYFGEGQQHARPGTETLCGYTAYETKESIEFRQLQARIAELERTVADWTTAWRRECDKVRELERVQGVLVGALAGFIETIDEWYDFGKKKLEVSEVRRVSISAIAEVKKPAQNPEGGCTCCTNTRYVLPDGAAQHKQACIYRMNTHYALLDDAAQQPEGGDK